MEKIDVEELVHPLRGGVDFEGVGAREVALDEGRFLRSDAAGDEFLDATS